MKRRWSQTLLYGRAIILWPHLWVERSHRQECVHACKMKVLRLMWTPQRAAGCVYCWISTLAGANSAGLHTLTSINLLWPDLELHPPRGSISPLSSSLFPPHSLSFPYPLFLLLPSFISPPSRIFSFPVTRVSFSFRWPRLTLPRRLPVFPPSLFLYLTSSLL